MKNKALKITLAIITSIIAIGGIIACIVCEYYFRNIPLPAFWIPLILSIFLFDVVCGLILFNTKRCSDELKAFWLFIMLILPITGCIFWLFLGDKKQVGYGYGQSGQTTLLSHIFKAKKSIKIYTNSWFISYDTFKALNYASMKNVKVQVILPIQKSKSKQKLTEYNINKFLENKVEIYFNDKEFEYNFIILDDKEVLFNDKNFNYKYMYSKTKMYLAQNIESYLNLWDKYFIRSSHFEHDNQKKRKWTIRLINGIKNIFYPFY